MDYAQLADYQAVEIPGDEGEQEIYAGNQVIQDDSRDWVARQLSICINLRKDILNCFKADVFLSILVVCLNLLLLGTFVTFNTTDAMEWETLKSKHPNYNHFEISFQSTLILVSLLFYVIWRIPRYKWKTSGVFFICCSWCLFFRVFDYFFLCFTTIKFIDSWGILLLFIHVVKLQLLASSILKCLALREYISRMYQMCLRCKIKDPHMHFDDSAYADRTE